MRPENNTFLVCNIKESPIELVENTVVLQELMYEAYIEFYQKIDLLIIGVLKKKGIAVSDPLIHYNIMPNDEWDQLCYDGIPVMEISKIIITPDKNAEITDIFKFKLERYYKVIDIIKEDDHS